MLALAAIQQISGHDVAIIQVMMQLQYCCCYINGLKASNSCLFVSLSNPKLPNSAEVIAMMPAVVAAALCLQAIAFCSTTNMP